MRILFAAAALCSASLACAADLEAGKVKVGEVCAACHGANGVSVTDAIPNLAGQKARYIESQLKALKDGSRKNQIMSAIATQLTDAEIANVAAFFSMQPGATGAMKSEFLPNLARSNVAFPENYKTAYTKYMTINFPATQQVRYYYANDAAIQAAKADKPLPDGAAFFVEVYSAKLDASKKPVMGADGFFAPDQLMFFTSMAREAGWGKDIPQMLRNENWNYAIFTTDKKHRVGVNHAECLACHKPLDKESFTFTIKQLTQVAKTK